MIDLVMLKDFLVLCRIKSFSRAAQECHVSVSGLSRRIQTLEQWLGAPVFERHKHALELTEAGRQLQGVAQDAVRALDNLRQSIRERDEDAQRRIRFCAPHILSSVFFPHWIPRLQADFRSAKFSVDCDYLPQCLSRLRGGSVDYVVALLDEGEAVSRRLGIDSEAEFQRLELGHEQLVAVCAPDAAGQPLFNLDRLQTEALSFLGYSEECHLGWALEPLLRDSGLFLQRHHSSSQTEGLRFFAQSRTGHAGVIAQRAAGVIQGFDAGIIETCQVNPTLNQVVHHRGDSVELALVEGMALEGDAHASPPSGGFAMAASMASSRSASARRLPSLPRGNRLTTLLSMRLTSRARSDA